MSVEYCAISAKLKAMNRDTLDEADYEALLSKKTVNEICDYLIHNTGYSSNLEELASADIHRGRMEQLIWQEQFEDYMSLYQFMNAEQRNLLKFLFMRREIDYLKSRIRSMYTGDEQTAVFQGAFKEFFRKHSKINREMVHTAKTMEEYKQACKDTPYYGVLKRAEVLDADYFSVSMMLDSFYFQEFWKAKIKYFHNNKESGAFASLVGEEIDLLNMIWIYRGKKYFHMSNEMIYTYLIPVRYRLNTQQIKQMVDSDSVEKMIDIAKSQTPYGELFDNVDGEGFFIEENYRRMRYRTAKRIFVNQPLTMGAVFAYFELKEMENYKITTIIEGKRYAVDEKTIREHMMFS